MGPGRDAVTVTGAAPLGADMIDLTALVDGLVHEPTQTEGPGLDLTLAAVHRITGRGEIDFGGGEFSPAAERRIEPETREPDDEYGWWALPAGRYRLTYNEALADEAGVVLLQPRVALAEQGVTHPTLRVESLPRVPLSVGEGGVALKENARVSTIFPMAD